ncbi:hypothetical protein INR49_008406 [Caranx melampygus]|nr:hypothetical protein INR49_008406 [Caranx melampygus]
MKGIQGHCNSCYMDAALFSLFSCSSVLDSMLFKLTSPHDAPVQNTLLHDIVNPLRRCRHKFDESGLCGGRHVMKLRQQLRSSATVVFTPQTRRCHSHPHGALTSPPPWSSPLVYLDHCHSHTQMSRDKLELFAVLCIETSHYVSFVRYGRAAPLALLRQHGRQTSERDGFNIPEVQQLCPEVAAYLDMSPAELANQVPRD